jgi:hypothetical protein
MSSGKLHKKFKSKLLNFTIITKFGLSRPQTGRQIIDGKKKESRPKKGGRLLS